MTQQVCGLNAYTKLQCSESEQPHSMSSVFSFVENSQKVCEGTGVILCVPRSSAKPIRVAQQQGHRRSHFAKPLRGWSVLCAFMAVALQEDCSQTAGRLWEDDGKMTGRALGVSDPGQWTVFAKPLQSPCLCAKGAMERGGSAVASLTQLDSATRGPQTSEMFVEQVPCGEATPRSQPFHEVWLPPA